MKRDSYLPDSTIQEEYDKEDDEENNDDILLCGKKVINREESEFMK
jgi:hypothetical protein